MKRIDATRYESIGHETPSQITSHDDAIQIEPQRIEARRINKSISDAIRPESN